MARKQNNLTKQGVRNLDHLPAPKRVKVELPPECDHHRMRECHPRCGHFICPDCGLSWDRGAGQ